MPLPCRPNLFDIIFQFFSIFLLLGAPNPVKGRSEIPHCVPLDNENANFIKAFFSQL